MTARSCANRRWKKVQIIDVVYMKRDQTRQLMEMPMEDE